jgi:hypothetical protein
LLLYDTWYGRREILESENSVLIQNREALNFIRENGPDTLINSISINFRTWDKNRYQYQYCYTPFSDLI